MAELHEVHQSKRRIHVEDKCSGKAIYGADLHLPRMLYAKGVTTGYCFGEIHGIDTSKALEMPGVVGVYTAKDIPGINGFGAFCKDEQIFADHWVHAAADVVAVVVAETAEIARQGAKAVVVDITPHRPFLTVQEALKAEGCIHPDYPDNICCHKCLKRGDADKALDASDVVVDETYETAWVEHAYLEPEAIVAVPHEDGTLEMRGDTQNPFFNKMVVHDSLCLSEDKILINPDTLGGSFGGKFDQVSAMLCRVGLAALKLQRPISYVFDREESIAQSHKRHGVQTHIRLGATLDGKLTALSAKAVMDAGAYVNESPIVTWKSINCGSGPYQYSDVTYENTAVLTNNMVCGAMRGFGTPQAIYALENAMNELARKLGISPLDLRRKNFLREGGTTGAGHVLTGHAVSIAAVTERAAKAIDFDRKFEEYSHQPKDAVLRRGVGIACSIRGVSYGADSEDTGRAKLTVLSDGRLEVRCPMMEMGQGAETVLTQICADGLNLPASQVLWVKPETLNSPDTGPAGASRGTFIGGNAILRSIAALKGLISHTYAVSAEEVRFAVTGVMTGKTEHNWVQIYQDLLSVEGTTSVTSSYTVPRGKWDAENCQGEAFISYVYSCHAAEVEVDTLTGQVRVLEMTACHDCGRVINPQAATGQVTGGMMMGIGMALTEEVQVNPKTGLIRTLNYDSYLIPTAKDGCKMTVLFEENPDDSGPFGGKSLGEPAMEPAPAAVSGAVNMALGDPGAIRRIPMTLEDVFFAAHPEYREGKQ